LETLTAPIIVRALAKAPVHRHPMRVVTHRTGLSAELLRVWERRYTVVKPARSLSGRRLYTDADIERLRLLYRGTLGGRSIGQIAHLSTAALAELVRQDAAADRERGGPDGLLADAPPPGGIVDECLRAVERLDTVGLEGVLRRAVVALPSATLLDAVLSPLLDRIGKGWRDGTLRPVHGHLATALVRRVLDRMIETATAPDASPSILVATPAGQIHELGAMLVAAAAAAEGWYVTYLGASLPAEDIAEAALAIRARAVALSIVHPSSDRGLASELRRLRLLLPRSTAILAGGTAVPSYSAVLEEIHAERLDDLRALRARLRAAKRTRNHAR
jgi:DNA-binding transcriptional MerR regulator/methylmalonyl-CoA mutase cobalamin-binding subunit